MNIDYLIIVQPIFVNYFVSFLLSCIFNIFLKKDHCAICINFVGGQTFIARQWKSKEGRG